ncbi:hypothetical protein HHL22_05400 [Hymenobacter sp. RP-2-7]|uniref:SMI1/KNR4 family protein n=1 Tax=Hymenobacter polaris TaxID=2682546 RepID=A0A7Y0FLP5_9BACT|nr:SMI1/KNR4 family protein [Hymenobacter polaris]NML64636.1 hypothetical protein [Hymenobacter polaris]
MSAQHLSVSKQQTLLAALDFTPPSDYLVFIFSNNIIHDHCNYSYLGIDGSYLYGATDLIATNLDYNAAEFYPGYLLIGSNGGGEALAIEKATGYFVVTPFIGHDEETPVIIGQTWPAFWQRLQAGNLFGDNI